MPGRVPAHRRLVFHRGAAGFSSAKPLSSPPYKYLNLPRCCLPPRGGKKKNWEGGEGEGENRELNRGWTGEVGGEEEIHTEEEKQEQEGERAD